jgi:hypothetical protein
MSSSDKRKHKTLSSKPEIIKKLDKDENFLIWLKSMVMDVLRYAISGKWREDCFVKNTDNGPSKLN